MADQQICRYCRNCRARLTDAGRFCDQCGGSTDQSKVFSVVYGPTVIHTGRIPESITDVFGDHVLLDAIGSGGMGTVYRAMHRLSGQYFALKRVQSKLRVKQVAIRLLEREAKTQSTLVHPNVVRFFELARHGDQLAIVSELVKGSSLDRVIELRAPSPFASRDVAWFMRGMCRGLAVVHANGYVHADVKPSNFLLGYGADGTHEVKLTDFGIARRLRGEMAQGASATAGTPGYMSPEQLRGQSLTAASDLYSLGCVLYEMLTGRPVFPRESPEQVAGDHLHRAPMSLATMQSDHPLWLTTFVDRLLAKNAKERHFRHAGELLAALGQVT